MVKHGDRKNMRHISSFARPVTSSHNDDHNDSQRGEKPCPREAQGIVMPKLLVLELPTDWNCSPPLASPLTLSPSLTPTPPVPHLPHCSRFSLVPCCCLPLPIIDVRGYVLIHYYVSTIPYYKLSFIFLWTSSRDNPFRSLLHKPP